MTTDNQGLPQDQRDSEAREALQEEWPAPCCETCGSFECSGSNHRAESVEIPRVANDRLLSAMIGWREFDANDELSGDAQMMERIHTAIVREFSREPIEPNDSTWDEEFEREWQLIGVGGLGIKHHCKRFYMAAVSRKDFIESLDRAFYARPAPEALGAAKGELSDAEILDVASDHVDRYGWINGNDALAFARAILAKAKGENA